MNFNDFRINAYKNVDKTDLERSKDDKNSAALIKQTSESQKVISKPIFPVIKKTSDDSTAPQAYEKKGSLEEQLDTEFFSKSLIAERTSGLSAQNKNEEKFNNFSAVSSFIPSAQNYVPEKITPKINLPSNSFYKVPAVISKPETDGKDSVYRRVAKFLVLIGIDEAAKILPHLTEEQTEKIIPEIASIKKVDPGEAEQILSEFQFLVQQARESGGVQTAKHILEKAFGSDRANELLEKTVPFGNGKPFEFLAEADSDKVSALLKDEANPVRALVLVHLEPKIAADVIKALPEEEKKDIIVRLAKMKEVNPDIVRRVDKTMQEKLRKLSLAKSDRIDGQSTLAEILKRMSPKAEEEILSNLAEDNPELGENLRELLFTIQDILNADDKFIQNKLREMPDLDVAFLIAGKEENFRNKILSNVSATRKKQILETEDLKKPMRRSDCEKITSQFFSDLRRAYDNGDLFIKGRDEEYV